MNMASDADRIGPNPALSNLVIHTAERLDDSLLRDDALAESARLGSATAFAELFRRHRDTVHVIVRNLCRTEAETEEVLREAFLGAWRNFASFPPGARFSTWLYRMATNAALARSPRDRPAMGCSVDAFLPVFDVAGRLVPGSSTRGPDVSGGSPKNMEVTALLRDMLQRIDDRARAAFVLCDIAGLCPEEAAAIVGVSPLAMRSDAHRARLLLRGFIDRMPDAFGEPAP
jgi:RNA polymerase sigma-70 factor (ECF subfamily)